MGSGLPLTLDDFFSYDLYPVFKSLISFHLIFYSFDNTSGNAIFLDAKLFLYMFQRVIPQVSQLYRAPQEDQQLTNSLPLLRRYIPYASHDSSRDTTHLDIQFRW